MALFLCRRVLPKTVRKQRLPGPGDELERPAKRATPPAAETALPKQPERPAPTILHPRPRHRCRPTFANGTPDGRFHLWIFIERKRGEAMHQKMRRQLIQGVLAAGVVLPGRWSGVWAQATGTSQPGLILGKGPEGWCDEARNGGATVRWNDDDQCWWMWYYARDNNYPEGVAPAFGTGRIALAKSEDGIIQERHKGHLAGGAIMDWSDDPEAFDSTHIGSGDILRHKDEWLLWYFGFAHVLNTIEPTRGIGLAISETGKLTDFRRARIW